jgi:soluble lytic murein transglycosylase
VRRRRGRRLLLLGGVAVIAAGIAIGLGVTPIDRPAFIDRLEYPLDYGDLVREHAAANHLDAALVAAVIYEESRFRREARSDAGALGLMQLQPGTAETIARATGGADFRVDDLFDPDVNIAYGSWYLRHLLDKYGDERVALAAYNAGETTVDGWIAHHQGIVYADVQAYVDNVEHTKAIYRRAYGSSSLPPN